MQRFLLIVYFVGLFVFAVLILAVDPSTTEGDSDDQGLAPDGTPQSSAVQPVEPSAELPSRPMTEHSAQQPAEQPSPSLRVSSEQAIRTITSLQSDFEQPFLDLGYKSVYDAMRECEFRFMKKFNLPIYTPPVAFTHQLGRCNAKMNEHDQLQIDYLHEDDNDLRYSILIRPAKHKIEYAEHEIAHTYSLLDGTKAYYVVTPGSGYRVLSFEHDDWQYILAVPNQLHERVPPEELVRAANSVRTYYPLPINSKY